MLVGISLKYGDYLGKDFRGDWKVYCVYFLVNIYD